MAEHSTTTFDVSGLVNDVEILVDKFGVPHLYAQSQDDAFLAQGFNAARDRLFQMDLWRRRGLGRLSEVFGAHHAERDRAARLFLYRGDMRAEWLAYGSDTKRVTTSFVRGVNAFVTLARASRALLPAEFRALGYLPALWEPSDIARIRSHGLFYNVEQEVARARTLHEFGPEVENLRRVREPHHDLTVPDGLDISSIPDDVLRVYRLATTMPLLDAADREPKPRYEPDGSNNWVWHQRARQPVAPFWPTIHIGPSCCPVFGMWPISTRRVLMSLVAASRLCRAFRSGTTDRLLSVSRSSRSTKKISTFTRPIPKSQPSTGMTGVGNR